MGASGFDYQSVSDIRQEISAVDPELADFNDNSRKFRPLLHQVDFVNVLPQLTPTPRKKNGGFPLLLSVAAVEHTYRASRFLPGLKERGRCSPRGSST